MYLGGIFMIVQEEPLQKTRYFSDRVSGSKYDAFRTGNMPIRPD